MSHLTSSLVQSSQMVWQRGRYLIAALAMAAPIAAQAQDITLITGLDAWTFHADSYQDSLGRTITNNENLLLPDAFSQWNYKPVSPFVALSGNVFLSQDFEFHFQARADQNIGTRVDEASLQYKLSPALGFRLGVVNYKTSWCRTYDRYNVWMRDIEPLCVTVLFRDLSGGAPGAQVFTDKTFANRYIFQAQAGIYNPLLGNYAPDDFSGLVPSRNFEVTKNMKYGLSLNWLDLRSGFEARLSYMHVDQAGIQPTRDTLGFLADSSLSPVPGENYEQFFPQRGNEIYWGVSVPITPSWRIRATQFLARTKSSCQSGFDDVFFRCNLQNKFDKIITSAELSYQVNASNQISIGVSQIRYNIQGKYFFANGDLAFIPAKNVINSEQAMIAWRKDWDGGFFTVLQGILSRQNFAYPVNPPGSNVTARSHGYAVGFRVGYTY